ncbi:MAG: 4Fe-4S dicluster domain-containing protein [Clostridia bacterium]|nr:4Fe-4S dicluster domain-containing protein [Clostridia bacterium]
MQKVSEKVIARARELMHDGTVSKVVGWKAGEFFYDCEPNVFETEESLKDLVYNRFCGANLSKYMIKNSIASGGEGAGKVLVLLKPCDTYSFNQLLTEHRIDRENVYILGVGCEGMCDIDRIRERGFKGITGVLEADSGNELVITTLYGEGKVNIDDVLLNKCDSCKGKAHKIYDELISDNEDEGPRGDRFEGVRELEAMSPEQRFAFWQAELSKCIRCNACRNACPACSCRKCVFDNNASGIASKANTDSFEEKMFHIIRAFHVAGRCTDCGECTRVCPQGIPLHLFNRKYIKDINDFYGEYAAGEEAGQRGPLISFTEQDIEPGHAVVKGGN